jgi:hypothetical protein
MDALYDIALVRFYQNSVKYIEDGAVVEDIQVVNVIQKTSHKP